jgi:hypothetical protein
MLQRMALLSSCSYGVSHKTIMRVFAAMETSSIAIIEMHSSVSMFVIVTDTTITNIGVHRMSAQLHAPSPLIPGKRRPLHMKQEAWGGGGSELV